MPVSGVCAECPFYFHTDKRKKCHGDALASSPSAQSLFFPSWPHSAVPTAQKLWGQLGKKIEKKKTALRVVWPGRPRLVPVSQEPAVKCPLTLVRTKTRTGPGLTAGVLGPSDVVVRKKIHRIQVFFFSCAFLQSSTPTLNTSRYLRIEKQRICLTAYNTAVLSLSCSLARALSLCLSLSLSLSLSLVCLSPSLPPYLPPSFSLHNTYAQHKERGHLHFGKQSICSTAPTTDAVPKVG